MSGSQDLLVSRLDELVKMVLDEGLHNDAGVTAKVDGNECLHN